MLCRAIKRFIGKQKQGQGSAPDPSRRRRAAHDGAVGPRPNFISKKMTRSVLFDTETTGIDPLSGDRVIEIAALELIRDLPTGKYFHKIIDPERDVPEDATRIHGFTRGDLIGKPRFSDIVDDLLAFIGDDPLVATTPPSISAFSTPNSAACA